MTINAPSNVTRVSVLMGGWSSERAVSMTSGAAAVKALQACGYKVTPMDLPRDVAFIGKRVRDSRPDVVFNALHGRFGEDGCVQGVLDLMAIPYTHSGVLASSIAMHKPMAKKLMAAAGIAVAEEAVVTRADLAKADPLPRPYVVKPLCDGSSVGVTIVEAGDAPSDGDPDETVMVEAFIPGRELTVAVMGDRPLGVTEISTHRGFYDYEAKYQTGGSTHVLDPADIPAEVKNEAKRLAVVAHDAIGCRGVTRSDFRWDGERLVALEINTQPGLTPTSLVPEQAAAVGIDFPALCRWMVENAACDA